MRECRTCAFCAQTDGGSLYCAWTDHFVPNHCCDNWKPKHTNADRIRAMTDEELALWLDDVCKSSYDEGYTKETEEPLMSDYPSIASEWAKWLKEDA